MSGLILMVCSLHEKARKGTTFFLYMQENGKKIAIFSLDEGMNSL